VAAQSGPQRLLAEAMDLSLESVDTLPDLPTTTIIRMTIEQWRRGCVVHGVGDSADTGGDPGASWSSKPSPPASSTSQLGLGANKSRGQWRERGLRCPRTAVRNVLLTATSRVPTSRPWVETCSVQGETRRQ
jgi:hypothetical protein